MKESPILFSAPMVRALLDGSKTQTRRIMKQQPTYFVGLNEPWRGENGVSKLIRCPHGKPGDRLWVRETWQGPLFDDMDAYRAEPADFHKPEFCEYAADGGLAPEFMTLDDELVCRWRPSIHMPRWASRIMLEVTGVRVERLQDISEADAVAEGIDRSSMFPWRPDEIISTSPDVSRYALLWESINGAGSWDANPFVWVIEFRRIEA